MVKLKKSLVLILSLALITLFMNCSLVLAEEPQNGTDGANEVIAEPIVGEEQPAATEEEPVNEEEPVTEEEPVIEEVAGILPGSPLSWLDTLLENIQLALAWTPEQKADLLMAQISEREAEAEVAIEAGQEENTEIALNGYSDKISEAQDLIAALDNEELQNILEARNASNIQALGTVLDKLLDKSMPPQAVRRIAANALRSMVKSIEKYDKEMQKQLKHSLEGTTEILENGDTGDLDDETAAAMVVLEAVDEEDVEDQNTEEEAQDTAQEDAAVQEDNSGQDLNKGQAKKADSASDSDADSDVDVTESTDTDASVTAAEAPDDDSQNDNKNKGNGKGGGNGKN